MHKLLGRVQFVVSEKLTFLILYQTAHEIMSILINNSPEKTLQNWDWWNFDIAHATCNLHLCHNFALMLQLWTCFTWKIHSFSANQKSVSFFSCILIKSINMKCMIMFMVWYFNPLTPMSDQDRISPYNTNTISTR